MALQRHVSTSTAFSRTPAVKQKTNQGKGIRVLSHLKKEQSINFNIIIPALQHCTRKWQFHFPPADTSDTQLLCLRQRCKMSAATENALCEQTRCTCNLAKLQGSLQTYRAQTLQRIQIRSVLTDACKNPRFFSKFLVIGFGLSPGERGYSLIQYP